MSDSDRMAHLAMSQKRTVKFTALSAALPIYPPPSSLAARYVGRVEVRVGSSDRWAPVCGDGWGVREGMVSAVQYDNFVFPREHLIFQSQTLLSNMEKSSISNQLKSWYSG